MTPDSSADLLRAHLAPEKPSVTMAMIPGYGDRLPGFKSRLLYSLSLWPWASCFACFSFVKHWTSYCISQDYCEDILDNTGTNELLLVLISSKDSIIDYLKIIYIDRNKNHEPESFLPTVAKAFLRFLYIVKVYYILVL